MTIANLDAGMRVTLGQDRLDRLADALDVPRVRPGEPLPPLWHWASVAPVCAIRTSVRVRLFRGVQAGSPVLLKPLVDTSRDEDVIDVLQDSQVRVQTLTSPLRDTDPVTPPKVTDETLADDSIDVDALLRLFGADSPGSAANRVLGLLATHRLWRRFGGQLIAVALSFWSTPDSLRTCRRVVRLECEGRALFRVGAPGQPVSLTGTAWFGCGPGPSR